MNRSIIAGALMLASSTALTAQGWIIPRPCGIGVIPIERGTPPIARPRDCAPSIVRTASDVRVELTGRVLHYEVEERFVNRGASIGEADYLFPLPADAAFQDLKLSIDGQLVAGETMNALDARRIYENIVRSQRDPALVEWMGRGLLRARIFPLNPGEERRVVVRFQSVAQREGDALRVDYQRGSAPGQTNGGSNAGAGSFTLSYKPSAELGNPYSPTHRLDVSSRDAMRRVSVRGDARDLTLLVPVRQSNGAAAAISLLPYAPGSDDGFALITVTPPVVGREQATPRDVTLVLDVSGSMSGRKIEQARAAGHQLLGTLRPDDRFRIIDFSSDVRSFRDDFVSATRDNIRDAGRYLDALEAVGGTNIEGALREATRGPTVNGRLPLILFVTDGEPTVGERSPERLAGIAANAATRASTVQRIFTFGLGSDVNVSLLEQLAIEGHGTPQFVRPDESVERMVGIVAERLVDPVLTDVRVHVEGGVRLSGALPAQGADVFADRDLVILARYSGHGQARIIVDGRRRGNAAHWETNVDFPERERANPFVARLWATQRVGFLSAEKRRNGGTSEVDEEIRTLGERYGIPTEFTSYLVVEPRLAAMRNVVGQASGAAPVAPTMAPAPAVMREMRFESAKAAAAQRLAVSAADVDSLSTASGAATKRVGARTFQLRDGKWTDVAFKPKMETVAVKPFSKAYFDLLMALPELRDAFSLGNRVIIAGRSRAIELTENGRDEIERAALNAITKNW